MHKAFARILIPAVLILSAGAPAHARSRAPGPAELSLKLAIEAPPRFEAEVRPERPTLASHWVPGCWEHRNGQWAWTHGRWEGPATQASRWFH